MCITKKKSPRHSLNSVEQGTVAEFVDKINIFLNVIEDNSVSITQKIQKKSAENCLFDDEDAFLGSIEEDAEDITKALKVVREGLKKLTEAEA